MHSNQLGMWWTEGVFRWKWWRLWILWWVKYITHTEWLDVILIFFSGCGGNYSAENSFLTSPLYPSRYPPGRECSYLVSSPHGTYLSIESITMDIDCSKSDNLELRDGDSAKSPIIGTFCGTDTDVLLSLQTTQSYLWLKFTSNYQGIGKGFNISYESVNQTKWAFNSGSCGGYFSSQNGVLTSPSFPNSYPAAKDCVYVVSVLSGHYVNLTFHAMDIKCHASGQVSDDIEIRDGKSEDSPLIGQFCGNASTMPEFIQTTQNYMRLR